MLPDTVCFLSHVLQAEIQKAVDAVEVPAAWHILAPNQGTVKVPSSSY